MTTATLDIHTDRALAEKLARALANTTKVPTHVVNQDGRYLIQDDADLDCYGGRAAIVASFDPPPTPPPPPEPGDNPDIDTTPATEGPSPLRRPHAVTALSIQIESRLNVCPNCQGIHHIQACPEIGATLHAIYDTNELVQLWATSRTLLAAKLSRLSRAQLHTQAIAFAAWLDTRTRANLSAASVLHIWETFILAGGDPAQQKAAA